MDLIKYQTERDTELDKFKKDYSDLKVQYRRLLVDAVYEKDPAAQAGLVKQVLDINAELSTHVREFLGQPSGKLDQKTVSDLTNDIIKYQNEYSEIKNSEDKAKSIQFILNQKQTQLSTMQSQFNILMGMLGLGILIMLFLIFRSMIAQWQLPQVLLPSSNMLSGTAMV